MLGIIRYGEKHGGVRFDTACAHALDVSGSTTPRRKYIEELLRSGLERFPPRQEKLRPLGDHENVLGGAYYDKEKQMLIEKPRRRCSRSRCPSWPQHLLFSAFFYNAKVERGVSPFLPELWKRLNPPTR